MMMLMKMVEGESDTAAESEEEEDGAFTSLSLSLAHLLPEPLFFISRGRARKPSDAPDDVCTRACRLQG